MLLLISFISEGDAPYPLLIHAFGAYKPNICKCTHFLKFLGPPLLQLFSCAQVVLNKDLTNPANLNSNINFNMVSCALKISVILCDLYNIKRNRTLQSTLDFIKVIYPKHIGYLIQFFSILFKKCIKTITYSYRRSLGIQMVVTGWTVYWYKPRQFIQYNAKLFSTFLSIKVLEWQILLIWTFLFSCAVNLCYSFWHCTTRFIKRSSTLQSTLDFVKVIYQQHIRYLIQLHLLIKSVWKTNAYSYRKSQGKQMVLTGRTVDWYRPRPS